MKRKILIITYHYPPDPISNPYPTASWAKYLPEDGWEPVILTSTSEEAMASVADPNVYRTSHPVAFRRLISLRRGLPASRLPFKLLNFLLINLLLYPDDKRGWFANAYKAGLSIAKNHQISIILSVGTPWTDHWVAGALSKTLKVPWIADYRDPWTQSTSAPYRGKWFIHHSISRIIEKGILSQALCCLHGSGVWAEQLGALLNKRVFPIPNGFDEADFANLSKQRPEGQPFTLAYVGTLHFPQRLEPFLEGFKIFVERLQLSEEACRLHFVGTGDLPRLRQRYHSLARYVRCFPYGTKQEAIAHMAMAHILLLFLNDDTGWYPTKVFEYIACGNTILASPDNGGVINALLAQTGAGVVKHHPEQIAQWLEEKWNERCRLGKLSDDHLNRDAVETFNRRRLTGRLSEILSQCCPTER